MSRLDKAVHKSSANGLEDWDLHLQDTWKNNARPDCYSKEKFVKFYDVRTDYVEHRTITS